MKALVDIADEFEQEPFMFYHMLKGLLTGLELVALCKYPSPTQVDPGSLADSGS